MAIKLRKQAASTVSTPAGTHVQFFIDSDGNPSLKASTGTVIPVGGSGGVWPIDGSLLDGSGGAVGAYLKNQLLGGKTNMLDTTDGGESAIVMHLIPADGELVIGDRFAIKICRWSEGSVFDTVQILVSDGQTIEPAPFNDEEPDVSVTMPIGLYGYAEWQLDSQLVWRVVGYTQGFDPTL